MSRYASLFTDAAAQPPESGPPGTVYRILLVDDEPNVLSALRRVFHREHYEIVIATDGGQALASLAEREFHLIISDYMMPGINGAELLKRAKNMRPDMIRIMLTGHADTDAVMGAVNEGAVYKFILKPWNDDDLRVTAALALEQYDLIQRNRRLQQENAQKSQEITQLSKLTVTNRSQLAIMLHKRGFLNDAQVQELYKLYQVRKEPLIKLLLEKDWVEERKIRALLRKDLMVDEVQLAEFQVDAAVTVLLPRSFCERQWVIPLKLQGRRLMLAVADPMDQGLVDDLRFISGLEIQPVMADVAAIQAKINEVYGDRDDTPLAELNTMVGSNDPLDTIEIVIEDEEDVALDELLRSTEEPPAIRLVNAVILEALRLGVSDIHIQPRTKNIVVRYRIDGVLTDKIQIPHYLYPSLVSRIKIMAELNIAERRRPQDGRIAVKTPNRIVDLRISTLPTINGEKIVMRILDRNSAIHRIEELGFAANDLDKVLAMVTRPQGIILATGPTGSGKTTTLYSLLQHDATPTKNYITIEDPVEYYLDMAGQVHVREKIVDFAGILRAVLRQDPDVILLGEIRDTATADVAFQGALTGHLVYSTLHTNSAAATIARLFDLGLKPYVVASALEGIIAQRLVRRICPDCREPAAADAMLRRRLGPLFTAERTAGFRGRGCSHCHNSGYRGRMPLYEVLVPDDDLRNLIGGGASVLELTRLARRRGASSLLEDAQRKAHAGLTTLDEVLRVLGAQPAESVSGSPTG
ncbi:MAG: ATPase, T2SS/T4P/T4SS family [Pseudomonadota bacterium]